VGKILLVDDRPQNVAALAAALDMYADRLITAHSGEEALRLLLDRDVALILLDVQLPTMDGFEVARLVRQRERSRSTPIIFVTAFSQSDTDVLKGYALGAVDFLFKPIVTEVLCAKVRVLLALQERTAEVEHQAKLLRDHERREHERVLEEERSRWEQEALRRQMTEERRRADELRSTVNQLERVEAELTRTNQELEAVDRRKDEFLAVLAHELRNPLAPLAAGLDILRETASDRMPPEALKAREAMERQLTHLTRLVDDLLDLARIQSGSIELRREPIVVADIVSQAIQTSTPLIEKHEHELTLAVPEQPLLVNGDMVRLVQVVSNLLNNAARYTPPHGHIWLEAASEDSDVVIRVRDNGRGIPPGLLASVFDMFTRERLDNDGLGVGLALVNRLVRLHEGRVEAKSFGPNQGSEFIVRLPAHDKRVSVRAPSPPPRIADVKGLKVVVVEDNDDIRELMCASLEHRGFSVSSASDGESGVKMILELEPDVAVVDMGLPVLDGCEVAERVRAALGRDAVCLIAMTGYGQPTDRERAKSSGFDNHLVKPVAPKHLVDVIAETLRR
jgi:signal transduction histidine kinase